MARPGRTVRIRVDAYTRFCLTLLAVLMTVAIFGLWGSHSPTPPVAGAAEGQIFGSTKQRGKLLDVTEETNQKLDQIIGLLKSGEVQVQVVGQKEESVTTVRPKTSGGSDAKLIIRKTKP
ncbi:MAG: hypothetical protein ACLFV7_07390 [Phycisphaerae bacterium]